MVLMLGFTAFASPPEVVNNYAQTKEQFVGVVIDAFVMDVAADFTLAPDCIYDVCFIDARVNWIENVVMYSDVGAATLCYDVLPSGIINTQRAATFIEPYNARWRSLNLKTCNYSNGMGVINYNRYKMICPVRLLQT